MSDVEKKQTIDEAIIEEMQQCYADPLRFVKLAFPWGVKGTDLEYRTGPDEDQTEFLRQLGEEVRKRGFNGVDPVKPIKMARSSGRGTGKTARAAWIVHWIMSTRMNAIGTVTANTSAQLQTKTWAAIRYWGTLCITSHWFEITSQRMVHRKLPAAWFCNPLACKPENYEAFLGQHSANSTSFYIVDEGSGVPDKIYEAAKSSMTDGEPMMIVFGNPTKRTGQLFRACFGSDQEQWNHGVIDARNSALSNKEEILEAMRVYGEDSDYCRVWIYGLPPNAADLQFIEADRVQAAQHNQPYHLDDDALIVGVDISAGGKDKVVFRFRRGMDAVSIPPIRIQGEATKDTNATIAKIAQVAVTEYNGRKPDAIFVDATGVGYSMVNSVRALGHKKVVGIQFGSAAPDPQYANMRAYIWGQCKEALPHLAIERAAIPSGADLETDLTGPCFSHDKKGRILLESKESMEKRGLSSPDDGDALCLTWAHPVKIEKPRNASSQRRADLAVSPWS